MGNIAAAVLAGPKIVSIDGKNRALTPVGGIPMINRVLTALEEKFDEIMIVAGDPKDYASYKKNYIVIGDIYRETGPLGGIHAALAKTTKRGVFFAPCDTPNLNSDVMKGMIDILMTGCFDCVVPVSEYGIEPLQAVYSRSVLPELERIISSGHLSVTDALGAFRCANVRIHENDNLLLNVRRPVGFDNV